jgi:hypothetical protein
MACISKLQNTVTFREGSVIFKLNSEFSLIKTIALSYRKDLLFKKWSCIQ